jgi:hypothetical protein
LGSIRAVPLDIQSPGVRITCAGTVAGWNLSVTKVTVKSLPSGGVMLIVQGVLQPGPREVRASAPGGVDASWTCTGGGVDLNASHEREEQPARLSPAAAITMTRRMIHPSL